MTRADVQSTRRRRRTGSNISNEFYMKRARVADAEPRADNIRRRPGTEIRGEYHIRKCDMRDGELDIARTTLTIEKKAPFTPWGMGKPKRMRLFEETDAELIVPRTYGVSHFGYASAVRTVAGLPLSDAAKRWALALRNEPRFAQQAACDAVIASIRDQRAYGCASALLQKPPGSGKTATVLKIGHTLGRRMLVLVCSRIQIKQFRDAVLGDEDTGRPPCMPEASVGIIGQRACDPDADVVLATVQTIGRVQSAEEARERLKLHTFGTVILDECHIATTEQVWKALRYIPAAVRVYCTATVDRDDGEDIRRVTGPVVYRQPWLWQYTKCVAVRYHSADKTVPMLRPRGGSRRGGGGGMGGFGGDRPRMDYEKLKTRILADTQRDECLVATILRLLDAGHRKLVAVDVSVPHLRHIAELVNAARPTPDEEAPTAAVIAEDTKDAVRTYITKHCAVILGSFTMLWMAFDCPDVSAVVSMFNRKGLSFRQQLDGRCQRYKPGKMPPLVVDWVDALNGSSIFDNAFRTRADGFYRPRGYDIQFVSMRCAADAERIAVPSECRTERQCRDEWTASGRHATTNASRGGAEDNVCVDDTRDGTRDGTRDVRNWLVRASASADTSGTGIRMASFSLPASVMKHLPVIDDTGDGNA